MSRPFVASLLVACAALICLAYSSPPQPVVQAQGPKAPPEYKIVWSPISHISIRTTRTVEGTDVDSEHSPRVSAEAMTKQFNALAAEGWEYVGPIAPTGKQTTSSDADGLLSLFRKAR